MKVALVTGSSSGIGRSTALLLARNGIYTYASMRDTSKGFSANFIKTISIDVRDDNSVREGVNSILEEKGRIDILINNAGYGLVGCLEDLDIEEIKAQFETNFFGVIRMIQAVLPAMRKQKSGLIINVSSVGGRIGFPVTPAYISSKFALEGLSESIRYELEPFGINVVIVEPGAVRSNFVNALVRGKRRDSAYSEMTEKISSGLRMLLEHGTPSDEVAKVILKIINTEKPEPRYIVGNDAAMILEARKNMSDSEFEIFMKKEILQ